MAPAQQGGGIMSGLASTVMQGMAFGTGSAIAHRAVGAIAGSMGGGDSAPQAQTPAAPAVQAPQSSAYQGACSVDLSAFNNCMRENNNNVTACDFYYQALQQCQSSSNY
jgi:coiled-coil-helix-coiled-coil-helix domain-containing protein 10